MKIEMIRNLYEDLDEFIYVASQEKNFKKFEISTRLQNLSWAKIELHYTALSRLNYYVKDLEKMGSRNFGMDNSGIYFNAVLEKNNKRIFFELFVSDNHVDAEKIISTIVKKFKTIR